MVMKNVKKKIQRIPYLFLLMLFSCLTASAQQGITVKGTVVDDNGETIIGASVVVKGNNSIGTISDIDGNFELTVPNEKSVLVLSLWREEITAGTDWLLQDFWHSREIRSRCVI